jgi:AbrB family looped-hinge helix DNA binding protein
MALKAVVSMNSQGRVTIPAAARKLLRVHGETQFEIEATERELVLRPAVVIPREDLWAYTPEHMASLDRALKQVREGRMRPASDLELGADGDEIGSPGQASTSAAG